MSLFEILDQIGVFTFTISGTRLAFSKKLDPFGAIVLGGVTAIGGGTLRDILLNQPVFWLQESYTLLTIIVGFITTLIFRKQIVSFNRTLFIFDTVGLGVFLVIGLEKALSLNLGSIQAIIIGTITAVFGGVVRDTLSNEIPLIFRKEMYATTCILGGILYLLLGYLSSPLWFTSLATIVMVIGLRIISIKFNVSYPPLVKRDEV